MRVEHVEGELGTAERDEGIMNVVATHPTSPSAYTRFRGGAGWPRHGLETTDGVR